MKPWLLLALVLTFGCNAAVEPPYEYDDSAWVITDVWSEEVPNADPRDRELLLRCNVLINQCMAQLERCVGEPMKWRDMDSSFIPHTDADGCYSVSDSRRVCPGG